MNFVWVSSIATIDVSEARIKWIIPKVVLMKRNECDEKRHMSGWPVTVQIAASIY
ncbi:MAG: hypothetical protein QMD80_01535 [archaeon]|nr:hypothetical protein [archaeon]